jgi:hypothetical protein
MTTMQSIFDKVWNHLVVEQKQGSYSIDEYDVVRCKYRSGEKLSCAAGCLVPDADYGPDWEDTAVSCLDYFSSKYNPQQLGLINQLQGAHDSACREFVALGQEDNFVEIVKVWLGAVAKVYKLTVPEERST